MGVYIPKDYTPEKDFPLLVFYGGGKGSDSPNPAKKWSVTKALSASESLTIGKMKKSKAAGLERPGPTTIRCSPN